MFSFGILAENFEVFENYIFDCKVLWMVGESEWNSVGFFVVWSENFLQIHGQPWDPKMLAAMPI